MDLQSICKEVISLSREVAGFIRQERKLFSIDQNIETKGKHDFVTHVDKGSEERIVEGLKKILPGSGFIAEEGTSEYSGEEYSWIIDPIDGTTNFIHGAPPYAISIALAHHKKVILGVVYEISMDECFYSYGGGKAFLNGEQIKVSGVGTVSGSLIATGFPYSEFNRMEAFMKTMDYFFHNSHGVRRLGSAATDLAYVACGRYDAFYEYNLNAWDVAAGAFLIEQAGGKVSDFSGGDNYLFGKEIVASNAEMFDEFQSVVGDIMNN